MPAPGCAVTQELSCPDQAPLSSTSIIHTANEIVAEWQYDATLPAAMYLEVPSKKFFSPGDLWWNGIDGFATPSGQTVFCDPRVSAGGPAALLTDFDDLLPRLDKIGCRLIWTMLGEKGILGESDNRTPRLCFSQMAFLKKNGAVAVGKRSFFAHDESQGPRK